MPSAIRIPARTELRCYPCEHHKLTGALHVRCGEGGYRQYACMHPAAFDDDRSFKPAPDPEAEKLRQRLIGKLLEQGRDIGKTEEQPDWCPLRRKAG